MKTCVLFLETLVLLFWEMLTNKNLNRLTQQVDSENMEYISACQSYDLKDSPEVTNSEQVKTVITAFHKEIYSTEFQPNLLKI